MQLVTVLMMLLGYHLQEHLGHLLYVEQTLDIIVLTKTLIIDLDSKCLLGMGRVPFFWRGTGLGPFFLARAGSRVKKILLGSCSGPKKIARVHFGSHFFPKYHTNLT